MTSAHEAFALGRNDDAETAADVDELCSRLDWIVQLVSLRTAASDEQRALAFEGVIASSARLAEDDNRGIAHKLLQERLGLSETEMQVIWILAAAALDERIAKLMLGAAGLEPALSLDTLRRVVYGQRPSGVAIRELGPEGALRRLRVIERSDSGGSDVHESRWSWTLSRRVLSWLHGDVTADPTLRGLAARGAVRHLSQLIVTEDTANELDRALRGGCVVVVAGSPGSGRRSILHAAAVAMGLRPLALDVSRLARDHTLAAQCRELMRECRLLQQVPLLIGIDALPPDALEIIGRELVDELGTIVLATSGIEHGTWPWSRPSVVVELPRPTSAQRARLWLDCLGQGSVEDGDVLANRYPLAPALIRLSADAALARRSGDSVTPDDIAAGVRATLDDKLSHLAKRVSVTQTWNDLVLLDDQLGPVMELISRVQDRPRVYESWGFALKVGKGLGTSALFSGPPGTGKTMVAALIARELGIELYQVDLAKVVSKFIGETEKQLAALFDAAEAGHAILLFDEADSLFGKRTEVRSSNDRYANLETNYLLQRLETFTGICLLTSNHESNIDPAFMRRLSLHVRFDMPALVEREQLWRATLPDAAPLARDIDFSELARRYAMSGGYIRNATLRAAFFAAREGSPISATHLETAARLEYEAMGKIVA